MNWWCAYTNNQNLISITTTYLTIYNFSTGVKKAEFKNPCEVLNYAGSIGSYELFTHAASAVCDCQNLTSSPCPVGMDVENASAQTLAYFTPLYQLGYLLSGYYYQESFTSLASTAFANASWSFGMPDDPDQSFTGCANVTDKTRVNGNWVLIDLNTAVPFACTAETMILNLVAQGAAGIFSPLGSGQSLYYVFYSQYFNVPVVTIDYAFYQALVSAYRSPGTSSGNINVTTWASGSTCAGSSSSVVGASYCDPSGSVFYQCEGGIPKTFSGCINCNNGNGTAGCLANVAPVAAAAGQCNDLNASFAFVGSRKLSCVGAVSTPTTATSTTPTSTSTTTATTTTTYSTTPTTTSTTPTTSRTTTPTSPVMIASSLGVGLVGLAAALFVSLFA